MTVKMGYVVAMCRRGVLNSKSKRFFAIWPLTYRIYPQSECIEKYQFELCSKYDRENTVLLSYLDKSYFVAT